MVSWLSVGFVDSEELLAAPEDALELELEDALEPELVLEPDAVLEFETPASPITGALEASEELLSLLDGAEITLPVSKSTSIAFSSISCTEISSVPSVMLTCDSVLPTSFEPEASLSFFFPQPQSKATTRREIEIIEVIDLVIVIFIQGSKGTSFSSIDPVSCSSGLAVSTSMFLMQTTSSQGSSNNFFIVMPPLINYLLQGKVC